MKVINLTVWVLATVLLSACSGDEGEASPPIVNEEELPPITEEPSPEAPEDSKPNIIVFFTDDQGYADLGVQGIRNDIVTPNIDQLASAGVRMTNGYVTSPQCTPSRAALVTGQYPQVHGVDDNRYNPLPLGVETVAEKFSAAGYRTAAVGKWNLDIDENSHEWFALNYPELAQSANKLGAVPESVKEQYYPTSRGFDESFSGYGNKYWATFDLSGVTFSPKWIAVSDHRIDAVSKAAVNFVERNSEVPFFMQVTHYAPHIPLSAPDRSLQQFSHVDNLRRRYALAMMAAVDDGVGSVVEALKRKGIYENTLIFFISDNGAPTGMVQKDAPVNDLSEPWNGSLNTPLAGEKGMLTEGGVRVPFIAHWPAKISTPKVLEKPVSVLDAIYTGLVYAGAAQSDLNNLDGVDLLPALSGDDAYLDDRPLFFKFWQQSAIRLGKWKFLQAGDREYLFNLDIDVSEQNSILAEQKELADVLREQLLHWSSTLKRPVNQQGLNPQETKWYDYYLPDAH